MTRPPYAAVLVTDMVMIERATIRLAVCWDTLVEAKDGTDAEWIAAVAAYTEARIELAELQKRRNK